MYLDKISEGVQRDVKIIKNGSYKKDEDNGTPKFIRDGSNGDIEESTDGNKEEQPAFGAQLRKGKKQKNK